MDTIILADEYLYDRGEKESNIYKGRKCIIICKAQLHHLKNGFSVVYTNGRGDIEYLCHCGSLENAIIFANSYKKAYGDKT
jgi:ethanolamine utilization microcompartment shell protein EutL